MQKSRFYRVKPTLLERKTIGFGTPKRSYWLSSSYTRLAKSVFCRIFSQDFGERLFAVSKLKNQPLPSSSTTLLIWKENTYKEVFEKKATKKFVRIENI